MVAPTGEDSKSSHMLNLLSSFKLGREKEPKAATYLQEGTSHLPIYHQFQNFKEKTSASPSPHLISVFQLLLEGKEVALAINYHIVYLRSNSMPNWPSQIPIFLEIL